MLESPDSEHPRVSNREIIFKEFRSYVITISLLYAYLNVIERERERDRQTDRQTTCRSNTALCVASRAKK